MTQTKPKTRMKRLTPNFPDDLYHQINGLARRDGDRFISALSDFVRQYQEPAAHHPKSAPAHVCFLLRSRTLKGNIRFPIGHHEIYMDMDKLYTLPYALAVALEQHTEEGRARDPSYDILFVKLG